MGDFGIKVTNDNSDIGTADPRTISMSSQYTMFKIHSDGTQTGTITPGNSTGTITFTHGLGYVPAFWVYVVDSDGKQRIADHTPESIDVLGGYGAYAGTNTITCIYNLGYNWNEIKTGQWSDAIDSSGNFRLQVGREGGGTNYDCGVMWENVTNTNFIFGTLVNLPQGATIGTAFIDFQVDAKGTSTADGTIKCLGIDRSNLVELTDLGNAETAAVGTQTVANIAVGEGFGIPVTAQVQEIVDRVDWVSGGNMGFHIRRVDSPDDKWFRDTTTDPDTSLTIRKTGNATFSFRVVIFKDKVF